MSQWIGFNSVQRTRDGTPVRNGYGAQRTLHGKLGRIVEEITAIERPPAIRYRVVECGPMNFHNGEAQVRATAEGCAVTWSIRFANKYPLTGPVLRKVMQKMLDRVMLQGLKPHAERMAKRLG